MFELIALLAALDNKLHFAKKLAAVVRVAGYGAILSMGVGAFSIHQARAAYQEQSLELGADLLPLAPLLEDAHTFRFNGQKLHVSTAKSPDGLQHVLDQFEEACRINGDTNATVLHDMPTAEDAKTKDLTGMPILRHDNGKSGVVMCFVHGDQQKEASPLNERLQAFVETGDMGKVGKVRYAYATSNKHGTSIITVWTDDSFNIAALQPKDGVDTEGADPSNMPRPADASRFLTAAPEYGETLQTFGYITHKTASDAAAAYDASMEKDGWKIVRASSPTKDATRVSRAYMKNGRQGFAAFRATRTGDSMIMIGEGTGGAPLPVSPSEQDADGF